jgi:xylulokinase
MADPRSLRLGIDLGTSAVKTAVLDAHGKLLAFGNASFATAAELPGQAEQNPLDWLQAVAAAVAEAGDQLGKGWAKRIAGIGLAAQLPTLVALGNGEPLGPAIVWSDSRADAWASQLLNEQHRELFYRKTGMPIDGRYLAAMFRFHWHHRRTAIRAVLSAKDFLCHSLTGRIVTDPSTAAGYGVRTLDGVWDKALCKFWDLDTGLLPPVEAANSLAGPLNPDGARLLGLAKGVPVAVGAADSVASALAMGGLAEGVVSIVMGSSSVIMDAIKRAHLDPRRRYLVTPHTHAGWFGREMDILAAGSGRRWLERLFGWNAGEVESRSNESPPGSNRLFFAPYLAGGEQGAVWDPTLSAVLHGLALHHRPADIARAFLEGVQFEIRRCVEVLEESGPIKRVVVAGHVVTNPSLLQLMADILNRPLTIFTHHSPAAIGAALLVPAGVRIEASADNWRQSGNKPGTAAASYEAIYRSYVRLFPHAARPPAENTR